MISTKGRVAVKAAVAASAIALLSAIGTGSAAAQTQTGWVGPTSAADGINYLHTSTINNSPLIASSDVYPSFGQVVPAFKMGVQPRLFKSGALCQITNWQYNPTATARLTRGTTGNCGTGSYNSNGFIRVMNENAYVDYVTFPTNPLNYTAPASAGARTAATPPASAAGTNSKGQSFGSAAQSTSASAQPDLVLSYGTDGQLGYVKASDLDGNAKQVPLYKSDGTTVAGNFKLQ